MVFVLENCEQEDYETLSTHLFRRQTRLFIKNGVGRVGIDIETLFDICFISNLLHCKLLLTPFGFEIEGKKYHSLKIVREEDEDKDSRDRVLN